MSRARVKREGDAHGLSLRGKSSWNLLNRKIKRKERLKRKILGNYKWELSEDYLGIIFWELSVGIIFWKLSVGIIVWELSPSISSRRKVEIYRDTAVSKNMWVIKLLKYTFFESRIKDVKNWKVGSFISFKMVIKHVLLSFFSTIIQGNFFCLN